MDNNCALAKNETQELLNAVGYIEILKHSEWQELDFIYKKYGGPGNEKFAMNVALELGYMKGVRAERKRRKEKVDHQDHRQSTNGNKSYGIVAPADMILEIDKTMESLYFKNLYSLLGCARGILKAQNAEQDK